MSGKLYINLMLFPLFSIVLLVIAIAPLSTGKEAYSSTTIITPTTIQSHLWTFDHAGCFPKHLPDAYTGHIVLANLDLGNIPDEVQGVYWWNDDKWLFWAPGAPGCTLSILGGGHTFDYLVCVTGPSVWEIPLTSLSTVFKPSVGYVPEGWYRSIDDPYGNYAYPDGALWGLIEYTDTADDDFVMIFYGDVPSEIKGHETDGDALVEMAIEWSVFEPDETGISIVSNQVAGYAKKYDAVEDRYKMEIVFVADSTCVDIYTTYEASPGDEAQTMSLVNSLSFQ